MSHQSANPLWLCRVGGHGRGRGHDCHVDSSCGRRSYTHSSSRNCGQRNSEPVHGGCAHASADVSGDGCCSFSSALHSVFFSFNASVMSNNPELNELTNLSSDLVFVRQSDSMGMCLIQRRKSPLEPSTCSSPSLRCSHMSCFKADRSIANRFIVDLFCVG